MLICQIFGHKWGKGEYKQHCKRKKCTASRSLMYQHYHTIKEKPYSWLIDD